MRSPLFAIRYQQPAIWSGAIRIRDLGRSIPDNLTADNRLPTQSDGAARLDREQRHDLHELRAPRLRLQADLSKIGIFTKRPGQVDTLGSSAI